MANKYRLEIGTFTEIGAVVISLLALILAFFSYRDTRQFEELANKPKLSVIGFYPIDSTLSGSKPDRGDEERYTASGQASYAVRITNLGGVKAPKESITIINNSDDPNEIIWIPLEGTLDEFVLDTGSYRLVVRTDYFEDKSLEEYGIGNFTFDVTIEYDPAQGVPLINLQFNFPNHKSISTGLFYACTGCAAGGRSF